MYTYTAYMITISNCVNQYKKSQGTRNMGRRKNKCRKELEKNYMWRTITRGGRIGRLGFSWFSASVPMGNEKVGGEMPDH